MLKVESAIFPGSIDDARRTLCQQMIDTDAEVIRLLDDGKIIFEARLDERGWTVVVPMKDPAVI